MSEFDQSGDWNAMAHVRFLRAQEGASSGFTADLIEKLYLALDRSETNLRHWRDECGKLHSRIGTMKDMLVEITAHLGVSLVQSVDSDDQIIMNHVRDANEIAKRMKVLP